MHLPEKAVRTEVSKAYRLDSIHVPGQFETAAHSTRSASAELIGLPGPSGAFLALGGAADLSSRVFVGLVCSRRRRFAQRAATSEIPHTSAVFARHRPTSP